MYKLSLFLLLIGFGWGLEEDKHPEIPELPGHTNEHFKVTSFPYKHCFYMGFLKGYLFMGCESNEREEWTGDSYVVLYNNQFKEVKKIKIIGFPSLSKSGDIYIDNTKKDSAIKYVYPDFKPVLIEQFPFNYNRIFKEEAVFMEKERKRDSTFNKSEYARNKIIFQINNFKNQKPDSYSFFNHILLLRYGQKEYWLKNDHFVDDPQFKLDSMYFSYWPDHYEQKRYAPAQPSLFKFDDAKLGKEWRGRLAYRKEFFGLEYFNLIIAGDTMKFKCSSYELDGQSMKEFPGFNKKQVVLISEKKSHMFFVEKVK